jgi:hypothetical protein
MNMGGQPPNPRPPGPPQGGDGVQECFWPSWGRGGVGSGRIPSCQQVRPFLKAPPWLAAEQRGQNQKSELLAVSGISKRTQLHRPSFSTSGPRQLLFG